MSQFRKISKLEDKLVAAQTAEDDTDLHAQNLNLHSKHHNSRKSKSSSSSSSSSSRQNRFEALFSNDTDDNDRDGGNDADLTKSSPSREDDEEKEEEETQQFSSTSSTTMTGDLTSQKPRKKRASKKKKRPQAQRAAGSQQQQSEDQRRDAPDEEIESTSSGGQPQQQQQEEEEEKDPEMEFLDQIILQQSKSLASSSLNSHPREDPSQAQLLSSTTSLFSVTAKELNPETELKRLFGSKVVKAESASSSSSSTFGVPFSQLKSRRQGRAALRQRSLFGVALKSDWPPYTPTGLKMVISETKNGFDYFSFVHDTEYQRMDDAFRAVVATHDPNNLVALSMRFPYHVQTLLQLGEVFLLQNLQQEANDMMDRALFALEAAFHPSFTQALLVGTARLVSPSICRWNRDLFEVLTRRVHSLGKMGCLRAALEYCKLVFALSPEHDPMHVLLFIDHFAIRSNHYLWLLHFMQYLEETQRQVASLPNLMFSRALASFSNSQIDQANQQLKEALQLWPMKLCALIAQADNAAEWERLLRHSVFTETVCESPLFSTLMRIAVKQNAQLWTTNKQVMDWLQSNVRELLASRDLSQRQQEFSTRRRSLYVRPEFVRYQGVTAEEVMGTISVLPAVLDDNVGHQHQETLVNQNPLMHFLLTLLPWNQHELSEE